jgi:hypothetical protein
MAIDLALPVPDELLARCQQWSELKRWARRELGQELRRLGLSYREIASLVSVSRSTLSGWCRDIELSADQRARLAQMRPSAIALREKAARRRASAVARHEAIRRAAREEVASLIREPLWLAGVVAYWSEGAKTSRELLFSNSDAGLIQLFIRWSRDWLGVTPDRFSAKLHLHSGQDETERRRYWSEVSAIPLTRFGKTFIKPEGTGHRKNVLWGGTLSIRIARSGRDFQRVMGWIEGVRRGPIPS